MRRATTYARAIGLPPPTSARILAMQRRVQVFSDGRNHEDHLHLALPHATISNSRTLVLSLFRGPRRPTAPLHWSIPAVLCTEVICQALAKRRPHPSISQAEPFTLEQSLRFFYHRLRALRVVVHMDSQVALRCICRRYSPVFVLRTSCSASGALLREFAHSPLSSRKSPGNSIQPTHRRGTDQSTPSSHRPSADSRSRSTLLESGANTT